MLMLYLIFSQITSLCSDMKCLNYEIPANSTCFLFADKGVIGSVIE